MLMRVEPLQQAIKAAQALLVDADDQQQEASVLTVYLSPQGTVYTQQVARELVGGEPAGVQGVTGLVLVAGRYEGIDERIIELCVDQEWSTGDYVLSGGEPAAMVVIDSVARLLPGVLGNSESAENDSFGDDGLLDCPHYTRPVEVGGLAVPEVLTGGDHQAIRQWRRQQALLRTAGRRPDLLKQASENGSLTVEDISFLREAGFDTG